MARRQWVRSIAAAVLGVATGVASVGTLHAQEGMQSVPSPHDVATTLDRLEAVLAEKGMTVFARVNHAAGAENAGLSLPPAEVLVFGNPKVGTPLMNCSLSIAIDLPQKMLAWQAADGSTRLGWNDPAYLQARHGTEGCDEVFGKVSNALNAFAKAATSE